MGRKALFIYSRFIMLATTFLVAMFTIIGYYAGNSLPVHSLFPSALVFFMPFLYAMNIVLVFYWIFRRRWIFLAVPIITLIWTYGYIITLVNYHGEREVPEGTLSVATFNVRLFNQDNTGLQALDIKNMFLAEQVDVICFQEYNDHVDGEFGRVTANMQDAYPYVARGNNDMVILSK